jgi:hypothetical protein
MGTSIYAYIRVSQISVLWQRLWKMLTILATALELWAGNLLILLTPVGYGPSINLCLLDFLAEVWQMPGHERLTLKGR